MYHCGAESTSGKIVCKCCSNLFPHTYGKLLGKSNSRRVDWFIDHFSFSILIRSSLWARSPNFARRYHSRAAIVIIMIFWQDVAPWSYKICDSIAFMVAFCTLQFLLYLPMGTSLIAQWNHQFTKSYLNSRVHGIMPFQKALGCTLFSNL